MLRLVIDYAPQIQDDLLVYTLTVKNVVYNFGGNVVQLGEDTTNSVQGLVQIEDSVNLGGFKPYLKSDSGLIYHGDCLEIMKLIPDGVTTLALTSPPYNSGRSGKRTNTLYKSSCGKYRGFNDNLSIEDYIDWQTTVIGELLRICKLHVMYNIQLVSGNKRAIPLILTNHVKNFKEVLIWDKGFKDPTWADGVFNSIFEFIFIFSNQQPDKRSFESPRWLRGTRNNIIYGGRNYDKISEHGAMMPITLATALIADFIPTTYSTDDIIIVDPFLGTGVTVAAAKSLGYKYIGIEIDEVYCKIAKRRLNSTPDFVL